MAEKGRIPFRETIGAQYTNRGDSFMKPDSFTSSHYSIREQLLPPPYETHCYSYSQRNFSNSFIVDGLSNNDDAAGVAGNVLGLDVVQQFQVVTAGGQAEFGRALGGYFNMVTKNGTNKLHGTAYGFLRNQRLYTLPQLVTPPVLNN